MGDTHIRSNRLCTQRQQACEAAVITTQVALPLSYLMMSALVIATALCASVAHGWLPSTPPAYCSKDIASKQVPPLSADELAQVVELKQVQVMIRHGARTPYALFPCWKDYDVSWNNCNVTELMIESPSMTAPNRPAEWLFRKLYDGSANYLGGNCLTGQLLTEGYEQEMTNGEILYNAYIAGALPLFPTNDWEELNTTTEIYLRSDDEQRTLMSGQIMLHSFLNVSDEVIVPWHTGDYNLDQIYPNSQVCPRLNTLEDVAYASSGWVAENTSAEITQLTADLDQIWGAGYWNWNTAMDCMMTTVCTGRALPDGSADTVLMTDAIFNATVAQSEYTYAYPALYNNSIWSKYATGNTAWHFRNNLQSMIDGTPSSASDDVPLKFALFSAHDTSLMPFLAALLGERWDGRWAGYAYMITIELYSASASSDLGLGGFYFRLYYDGEILTLPGCDAQLCDANILIDALSYGQESMPCSVPAATITTADGGCSDDDSLGTDHWILITLLTFMLGGLLGAGVVVFVDRRRKMQEAELGTSSHPLHSNL